MLTDVGDRWFVPDCVIAPFWTELPHARGRTGEDAKELNLKMFAYDYSLQSTLVARLYNMSLSLDYQRNPGMLVQWGP